MATVHVNLDDEQEVTRLAEKLTKLAARYEASRATHEATTETAKQDNPTMADVTREEMDAKITGSAAGMRAEWAEFRSDMKTGLADIRVEMHKGFADTIKWTVGTIIASMALAVGVITYLGKPPPPPQQQPIVIALPVQPILPAASAAK